MSLPLPSWFPKQNDTQNNYIIANSGYARVLDGSDYKINWDNNISFQYGGKNSKITMTNLKLADDHIYTSSDNEIKVPDSADTLVNLNNVQTLTNKTLTTPIIASLYQDVGKTKLITIPDTASDTLLSLNATQTINNKTLTDSTTYFQDNADNTKKLQLQLSSITTGNTRTLSVPDLDDNITTSTNTATLTNKTLTTPIIPSLYQDAGKTKLMTIPNTASDTILTENATQTLTNKTLTTPIIASLYQDAGRTKLMTIPDTASDTILTENAIQNISNKTFTGSNSLIDSTTTFYDDVDPTKKARLDLGYITPSTTRGYRLPNITGDVFIMGGYPATLTNKRLDDSTTVFQNTADNTKKLQLQLSSITTGNTRTLIVPDLDDNITTSTNTATLTNKTLTTPIIASLYQDVGKTKLITIPDTASDTLVSLNATQTLTNKTLTDNTTYLQDNTDNTKKLQFQLSGISTSNTRILTAQNKDMTLQSLSKNAVVKNGAYTLTHLDEIITFSGLSGSIDCSLPQLTSNIVGKNYIIIHENSDPYIVTVKVYSGDFFNDGITTEIQLNNQYDKLLLYSNGTQWYSF